MKIKIFTLFVALLTSSALSAYDFQSGDLYYNITSDTTVEVTSKSSSYPYNEGVTFTTATIPETVTNNGTTYSVTRIGEAAFKNCSSLTSVTIPNSVTSIGSDAFSGCDALTSVTIPNSVTSIGKFAFVGCCALTSITIPNSVTSIGSNAFSGCSSLTSVTIPNSVTTIGNYPFYGCQSLESIVVEQGNVTYDSRENCNAIIETATNTLVVGCKNTTIPNSVTSIGKMAFYDCQNLNSIVIPNSITNIGESAFGGCISLTSITIPNSVTDIGEWAFEACISLASCTIGNGVRSIGYAAFYRCISLTSITIPQSVTNIGEVAFGGCYALTSIFIENENTQYDSRENCNAIIETSTNTLIAGCQNTIIPNNVTSIGSFAFYDCLTLTSITIPNSVTSIGEWAFSYCDILTTVICEATEVPELGYDVFYDMPLSEATLYVPAESLEDYKAAEQWKEFGTILPLDKVPNSVENIQTTFVNGKKLLRNNQLLILREGKTYSVMGQEM